MPAPRPRTRWPEPGTPRAGLGPCRAAAVRDNRGAAHRETIGAPASTSSRKLSPVRAPGLGGRQAALQHVRLEAALAQDVRGRGTAPARVAADDILSVLVERIQLQPNEVQRN